MTVIRPAELAETLGETLAQWLVEQRWFRAKGREVTSVRTLRSVVLVDADPGLVHTMISVDGDAYQLLLGLRADVPDYLEPIGTVDGLGVYDATQDAELMGVLFDLLVGGGNLAGLRFEADAPLEPGLRARPIGVEQSNTSIIFGDQYILKLYRQPDPGPNREVELHRALDSAGSTHIAAPLGVLRDERTVLGFLQRFLPDAVEGWATATASVRDLLAEGDLHADEVGGDFAGEARRLGVAVAEVHAALAGTLGTTQVGADALGAVADAMHARLDAVLAEVPSLAADEAMLRGAYDRVRDLDRPVRIQRVHGDLHLGQVLRATAGWILIDFEGEPAATPEQRDQPRSPLRDVAAMLFSFDFAAFHLLAGEPDNRQLLARATEWSDRNRTAFCDGYAEVAADPRDEGTLLRALELDQAVYEVHYEHNNRPDWLAIPLAAIRRRN